MAVSGNGACKERAGSEKEEKTRQGEGDFIITSIYFVAIKLDLTANDT